MPLNLEGKRKFAHTRKRGCCAIDDKPEKLWECPHWLRSMENMVEKTFKKGFEEPVIPGSEMYAVKS